MTTPNAIPTPQRQFDGGDEDTISTSSVQRLEIIIDGITLVFYVRRGEQLFSNQNSDSKLEKTERNAYIDTTHEYRFTSKSSNVYGRKEGRGVRISKDSGESTEFIWETKSDPNSHGAESYTRFSPAVYEPDRSNEPKTLALEAYRLATEVRGRQANPSTEGIALMEEGDELFENEDYAGARAKYNEGKAKFEESEKKEEEGVSSMDILYGFLITIAVFILFYYYNRSQRKVPLLAPSNTTASPRSEV